MKTFREGYFMASERSRWDAMTIVLCFEVGRPTSFTCLWRCWWLSCFTLVALHCLGCRLVALPAHLTWMPASSRCGTKIGKNKVLCYVTEFFRVLETFLVHLNGGLPPQGQQSSVGYAGWNPSPAPALHPKQVLMTNGINLPLLVSSYLIIEKPQQEH